VLRAVTPFSFVQPPFAVIGLYLLSPISFNFVRIPRIGFASRPRSGRRGIKDLSTFSSALRYFQLYRTRSFPSSRLLHILRIIIWTCDSAAKIFRALHSRQCNLILPEIFSSCVCTVEQLRNSIGNAALNAADFHGNIFCLIQF